MQIERTRALNEVLELLQDSPIVAILGPRQVGKTTLALEIAKRFGQKSVYLDLENPATLSKLSDPLLALQDLEGLVVLDEVQRLPEIFPILRVLADRQANGARFLILGSASPALLKQSSETLAGRIAFFAIGGFTVEDIGIENINELWLKGGFPRSFLARSLASSMKWRRNFIKTFLERDIPQLGIQIPEATLLRFWTMLANYHGQIWHPAAFAASFGVSDASVRRYLDILRSTYVVQILQPWSENIGKRQVKAPKVYITDTGLLHALLNLPLLDDVLSHPKCGFSWEAFVIQTLIKQLNVDPDECFFWGTHGGAELDFLVVRGMTRIGFEVKRTLSPQVTPSMLSALSDLKLSEINVVYPGNDSYLLAKNIHVIPLSSISLSHFPALANGR